MKGREENRGRSYVKALSSLVSRVSPHCPLSLRILRQHSRHEDETAFFRLLGRCAE